MIGFDSSNQNAGLFGQFTYSTSILPCLLWTILQDWVSPFMFILIKLPTLNILMLKMGHIRAQLLITSVPRSWHGCGQGTGFGTKAPSWKGGLSEPDRKRCSRLSLLSRLKSHNGTQTMECFEISGPAAFFSYHTQKPTLYRTI